MPDRLQDGPDAELLGRYLAGECSEAEAALVRRFLMSRPGAAHTLDRFLAGLDDAASRPPAPDSAASWGAFRRRLQDAPPIAPGAQADAAQVAAAREALRLVTVTPPAGTPVPRARRSFEVPSVSRRAPAWQRGALAASLIGALAFGTWTTDRASRRPPPAAPEHAHATVRGQLAELRLADGTRVRLAPLSRLRVPAGYGSERRDVWLEGEAYFDVVHDASRPFTVHAAGTTTRDIGTRFAVRRYAEDPELQVVVREGAVTLGQVGMLHAGDVARLRPDGAATVRRGADVDALLAWMDGRLVYDDASLGRVLRDVHRWYGVDVALGDSALAALPFTGTITGLSPRAAVDLVASTLGLRVHREGPLVRLDAQAGRTPRASRRAKVPVSLDALDTRAMRAARQRS